MLSIQRRERLRYLIEKWLLLSSPSVSMTEVTGYLAMIFGVTIPMLADPTTYPMPCTAPMPYVQDVHDIVSLLMRYVPFNSAVHHTCDLASFEVLLLFCTSTKSQAKIAQYIPFVKLLPTQVAFAMRKGLLRQDTRIGPMIFPSCTLEYWSDDSGIAGFLFGSAKKIYNPHYFEMLDFISMEEMTWEMDPHHFSAEFGSKSWQKKEFRCMKQVSARIQRRKDLREGRAAGVVLPCRKSGTNN